MLYEIYTNAYNVAILDLFTIASILCSILVIISKNPIVSVLFLIGLFLTISGYLIMLGINFIGLSYLLVYVGAVSILFLFILMLINVRVSELLSDTSNSIPLAIIIGIIFNYTIYPILPQTVTTLNMLFDTLNSYISFGKNYFSNRVLDFKRETMYVTSKLWDGNLSENSHITSIGNIMYTSYSI